MYRELPKYRVLDSRALRFILRGLVLIGIMALSATVSAAYAQEVVTTNCKRAYIGGGTVCQTVTATVPAPTPRRLSAIEAAAEQAATDARVAKWVAFCKPQPVQDAEGITRYRYAHKGCDMGRSE